MEYLKIEDLKILMACLAKLAYNQLPGRNALYPCGSNKKQETKTLS